MEKIAVTAPPPVADIQRGGLEDLAVRRPGQIAQVILGMLGLRRHLVQHHLRRPVAYLPAGHVAVFNVDNGVVRMIAGHIVDHYLTVAAELRGDARRQLLEHFQTFFLHSPPLRNFSTPP